MDVDWEEWDAKWGQSARARDTAARHAALRTVLDENAARYMEAWGDEREARGLARYPTTWVTIAGEENEEWLTRLAAGIAAEIEERIGPAPEIEVTHLAEHGG